MIMKKRTFISIFCLMIFAILLMTGCSSKNINPKLIGKWAYIHDKETSVLELKKNGEASYKGIRYNFTDDGTFLTLSATGEELKLRYELVNDDLYVYEPTTYVYTGEEEQNGLVGLWKVPDVDWSFEFLDNGEFKEDGYFPGYYLVDEANHTFKLVYNDHFEDATCYYEIVGDELRVEYPWRMVEAQ